MIPRWRIAPATAADAGTVAALESAAFGAASWGAEAVISGLAADRVFCLTAVNRAGDACGFIMWRNLGGDGEVLTLGVAPEARRSGAADALVEAAVEAARATGLEALFLEVGVANAPALSLYEKHGFAPVGDRRGYYRDGGDALVMKLAL